MSRSGLGDRPPRKPPHNPLQSIAAFVGPWFVLGIAALGGAAVVAGAFEAHRFGWLGGLLAAALVAAGIDDARHRARGRYADRPFAELEGPLLWIVGAWALIRLGGDYSGHLTPLAAGLVAWLVAMFPRRVGGFCGGLALVLEAGLTVGGHQGVVELGLHVVLIALSAAALSQLARGEVFRARLSEERAQREEEEEDRSRAEAFGLTTEQAPAVHLPDAGALELPVGRATLDYLQDSFKLQLELLRQVLNLETAAVLWRSNRDETFQLRGASSSRPLVQGPFPQGRGLPGSALREGREVGVAPVHSGFNGLPYYADVEGIGSAMAVLIPSPTEVAGGAAGPAAGVLCVDRADTEAFSASERRMLLIAARKFALDVGVSQRLKATDHERATIGRFSAALQRLNGALGMEQTARAASDAARALIGADLVVLSEVNPEGANHVVHAAGLDAERFESMVFAAEEGLVGQALKLGHSLPVGPYRRDQAVFGDERLSEIHSLRVVPLMRDDGTPIGALTAAARRQEAFGSPRKEMLEVFGGQVAVKMDLANAHEHIQRLATTDGLTGLKNRRVYEQAFENMLSRAIRGDRPMALIMADIDKFKVFNDTYGHAFGDLVLQKVAGALADQARANDLAARYGGEEMALLLEDAGPEGAMLLAERVREAVEALSFKHEKGPVSVTLSLGVACYPEHGDAKDLLMKKADLALYQAKEAGRNRTVLWMEPLNDTGPALVPAAQQEARSNA